jgi:hypothetical protein
MYSESDKGDTASGCGKVRPGVQQGCNFPSKINDLPKINKNSLFIIFGDYTSTLFAHSISQ